MPNASRELRKLKEKDLCEKVVTIDDKRKHIIRLSKKGQTMMNAAFQGIEARFLERIQHLSEDDLAQIYFSIDGVTKQNVLFFKSASIILSSYDVMLLHGQYSRII
jgi:DNA-binding MarR family transcriptional regulator